MSWKKLVLIRSEILALLDNTLAANCEYSRINRQNLLLPIQIKLSKKPEIFFQIFSAFFKSTLNLKRSEIKMSLIGQVFPNLLTPRDVLI